MHYSAGARRLCRCHVSGLGLRSGHLVVARLAPIGLCRMPIACNRGSARRVADSAAARTRAQYPIAVLFAKLVWIDPCGLRGGSGRSVCSSRLHHAPYAICAWHLWSVRRTQSLWCAHWTGCSIASARRALHPACSTCPSEVVKAQGSSRPPHLLPEPTDVHLAGGAARRGHGRSETYSATFADGANLLFS